MIKFGTSGFRGIMGEVFTKQAVQKVAFALAKTHKPQEVIPVGYDNRFMGIFFAQWVAEVLASYGFRVKFFAQPVPSPVIALETKSFGVMITASHNPYYFNGLKIFKSNGQEFSSKENLCLQKIANRAKKIKTMDFEHAKKQKQVIITQSTKTYEEAVLKHIDAKALNGGQKIVLNPMNGSSTQILKNLANKCGIDVFFVNDTIDPNFGFGLPAPYQNNLSDQVQAIKQHKAAVGIAFDGDGDRMSFLDEKGKFYDCNYISALIYDNLCANGMACDFVKNCAMTNLIDIIAKSYNQNVILAKTGFKHTAQKLVENQNAFLGAESNGIAFKNHILFKDGVFGALKVLEVLAKSPKPLSKQIADIKKKYHFACECVEYAYAFDEKQREYINKTVFQEKHLPKFKNHKIISTSYDDGLKIIFEGGYWGVIRFSGNENVIRLFAEMPSLEEAESIIKEFEKLIKLKIRQV